MSNIIPKFEIRTVSPELAEKWLTFNTHNRHIKAKTVRTVSRALRNGEWKINGEAIKWRGFEDDDNKLLLDGQNRLTSCIETGVSFDSLIAWGLDEQTQDTMDTGASRSLSDQLMLRGERNSQILAALVRRVYVFKNYGLKPATVSSYPTTNVECLNELESHPEIRDLIPIARKVQSGTKMPGSLAGLLYYSLSSVDTEDADFFFERLASGEMIAKGDPVYALRLVLKSLYEGKGVKSQTNMAALTVKAWNKFRAGDELHSLRFTPGGANPETFPEPK